TVRESQNLSGMEIWLDVLLVNRRLGLVRGEHVNPVGTLGGFIRRHHHHAIGASLLRAWAVRFQPYDDLAAAVAEILGLSVSLAAVAQDGDGFALQGIGIGVVFVENCGHREAPCCYCGYECWEPTVRSVSGNAIQSGVECQARRYFVRLMERCPLAALRRADRRA